MIADAAPSSTTVGPRGASACEYPAGATREIIVSLSAGDTCIVASHPLDPANAQGVEGLVWETGNGISPGALRAVSRTCVEWFGEGGIAGAGDGELVTSASGRLSVTGEYPSFTVSGDLVFEVPGRSERVVIPERELLVAGSCR